MARIKGQGSPVPKVHYLIVETFDDGQSYNICGIEKPEKCTIHRGQVTCKKCIARIARK